MADLLFPSVDEVWVAGEHATTLHTSEADGSQLHRLTYWDDAHAKWPPDGKKILLMSSRDGRMDDGLYVMNADGTSVQLITANQSDNRHADWCRSAAEAR